MQIQRTVPLILDAKGRFVIPVNFRDELRAAAEKKPLTLFWNPADSALTLCSHREWQPLHEKLNKASDFDRELGSMKKTMLPTIQEIPLDDLGERILISSALRKMARLEKDIIVTSYVSKLKIWSELSWEAEMERARQAAQEVSKNFLEGL